MPMPEKTQLKRGWVTQVRGVYRQLLQLIRAMRPQFLRGRKDQQGKLAAGVPGTSTM